ncbi:hypothetical protein AAFF_G00192200 [Aldrovandia affinis]|uniref:Uncharacterized protein n=1 Tax=Aldrovandia affinis TaxID=143900 RepID=A0AAD7W700_9TELE|nr:hypothetical protein AAFF_G00192200 [Aldrovandia affinis]
MKYSEGRGLPRPSAVSPPSWIWALKPSRPVNKNPIVRREGRRGEAGTGGSARVEETLRTHGGYGNVGADTRERAAPLRCPAPRDAPTYEPLGSAGLSP